MTKVWPQQKGSEATSVKTRIFTNRVETLKVCISTDPKSEKPITSCRSVWLLNTINKVLERIIRYRLYQLGELLVRPAV